ncbi:unnamed protein product [Danaus chrysippus]|uniref:(African queen) hypothetical protein n=1 Tax=Danaus chrysippus TaxID=151541 RepID=A0A8J2R189_9NEOP|nr:unnamed protein product [Danaus chrysippus]
MLNCFVSATWSLADSRRHKRDAASSPDYNSGSTMWAASLSCDSCGSECASACGTRHFRSCCFNYLRKKRGPDAKFLSHNDEYKTDAHKPKFPLYVVDDIPEAWSHNVPTDFKFYPYDDTIENKLQYLYDM